VCKIHFPVLFACKLLKLERFDGVAVTCTLQYLIFVNNGDRVILNFIRLGAHTIKMMW